MAREMADKEHNLLDKLVHSALFADSIGGHGFRNEQDLTDAEGPWGGLAALGATWVQGDMCTCHRLAAPLSIAPKCRSTVALLNY